MALMTGVLKTIFNAIHLFLPDAVRDSSSAISAVAGAPDPTFGRTSDTASQWQLSLNWLCETLKQDLQEMTHQRIYEYTSNTLVYLLYFTVFTTFRGGKCARLFI